MGHDPVSRSRLEVVAVHGWGFDRTCWRPWLSLFGDEAFFSGYDRGYFGAPAEVEWRPGGASTRVLLAHSMGLLFCDRTLLEGAHLVALFGCFGHFHPPEKAARRRSQHALARMRRKLETAPVEVVRDFRRRCDLPDETAPIAADSLAVERLAEDLARLDAETVDRTMLSRVRRVRVLHGTRDRIVPPALGAALARALGKDASFAEVPDAGHGLPLTHPEECWEIIAPHVDPGSDPDQRSDRAPPPPHGRDAGPRIEAPE